MIFWWWLKTELNHQCWLQPYWWIMVPFCQALASATRQADIPRPKPWSEDGKATGSSNRCTLPYQAAVITWRSTTSYCVPWFSAAFPTQTWVLYWISKPSCLQKLLAVDGHGSGWTSTPSSGAPLGAAKKALPHSFRYSFLDGMTSSQILHACCISTYIYL